MLRRECDAAPLLEGSRYRYLPSTTREIDPNREAYSERYDTDNPSAHGLDILTEHLRILRSRVG